ncbi:Nucleotidylyl transferase [Tuber magnatum]|uniref:Nucleotidylyl transferase n=1 Tax=Tuber magnatum TaxID=42249 RepID=A0A317SE06_9PEZI|nr:Nucleotidylyl transferase [Tuber magnatum]
MPISGESATAMALSLSLLRSELSSFTASSASLRLIQSTAPLTVAAKTLFVLDSSFNPPTRAHLNIALSSFKGKSAESVKEERLLLLLATQNADKAPKPAPFEERLSMISMFASDILSSLAPLSPAIDIAVTKHAKFLDKSEELTKHYPDVTEQVYLTGFDTLIRILDTRYYPVAHTLEPLESFFRNNRIRCMYRLGDRWGGREGQDEYLRNIRNGSREAEGCRKEWAERIEFIGNGNNTPVSSTRVREAIRNKEESVLHELLTEGVKSWLRERDDVYTQG